MKMMLPFFATFICIMVSLQNGVHATDFLFVQTASGATLNGTLTMTGVAVHTSYFADRPVRVAGTVATEEFLALFEPLGTFSEVRMRHVYHLCVVACVCVCDECI